MNNSYDLSIPPQNRKKVTNCLLSALQLYLYRYPVTVLALREVTAAARKKLAALGANIVNDTFVEEHFKPKYAKQVSNRIKVIGKYKRLPFWKNKDERI